MSSLNKVMIIGNLGKDPEIRSTPSGSKVANFSIATNEGYTDKNGQQVDRTEWHRIVMWRNLADVAEKYLKKGSTVYVEGKLTTRSWDDPNGQKKYATEIVVNNMQMLGGNQRGENAGQDGYGAQEMSQPYSETKQPSSDTGNFTQGQSNQQPSNFNTSPSVPEDDLPF